MYHALSHRPALAAFFVAGMLAGTVSTAFAQPATFPTRAVTLVVPYGPGGVPDVLARTLAESLKTSLGQPVVVENKAGAATMTGTADVARSAPDGYRLLVNGTALALHPSFFKTVSYNAQRDLAPIALLATAPNVLYVAPTLGVTSLAAFLDKHKNNKSLNYGSPGLGTGPHLAAEVFKRRFGLDIRHVPYPAGPAVFNDLIAGNVQLTLNSAQFKGLVETNKVRALAVTGKRRSELLPDVQTFAELGHAIPELDSGAWFGLFAPAGVSSDVVAKLNGAVLNAVRDAEIRRKLIDLGFVPTGSRPEEAAEFLAEESKLWPPILARIGIIAQ
jgi:tripartite-type tricarboxylate transporter receptor subunit TctC